jgi:hypothetical protein
MKAERSGVGVWRAVLIAVAVSAVLTFLFYVLPGLVN